MNRLENKYDIIIIRHVLEHITDVECIIENISSLMDDNSVFVIEVPYLKTVISKRRIENISHPHVNCFSIRSINEVVSKFNLGIDKFELVETDGGSIIFYIRKNIKTNLSILDDTESQELIDLKSYIDTRRVQIKELMCKFDKDEVVGFGAGAKGQLLIHFFELDKYIKYVVDTNISFENQYIPGTSLEIKTESFIEGNSKLKAVINLAPTHTAQLIKKIPKHLDFIDIIE